MSTSLNDRQTTTPIGLLGYPESTASALRQLGLLAVYLPSSSNPEELLAAAQTLGYAGILVHSGREDQAYTAAQADDSAQRAEKVDAIALPQGPFGGQYLGTYTYPEALTETVERSGFSTYGAQAIFIGQATELHSLLPLSRLGFSQVGFAAEHAQAAEYLTQQVPAGVSSFGLSQGDPALQTLAERANIIVLASGTLPSGVMQPHHTLLDLTGRAAQRAATHQATIDTSRIEASRLSLQLHYITGEHICPEELQNAAESYQPRPNF